MAAAFSIDKNLLFRYIFLFVCTVQTNTREQIMNTFIVSATVLILATLGITVYALYYLTREHVRRLRNNYRFMAHDSAMVKWHWKGASTEKAKPGMYAIMLKSKIQTTFKAQVGFFIAQGMIDNFGFVESGPTGIAVFETYLGKGPVTFTFLLNKEIVVEVITGEECQHYQATAVFPPHWWQRLGFFS